jgi:Peptidase family M1 domain/Secretion system C-terminal sorting domain
MKAKLYSFVACLLIVQLVCAQTNGNRPHYRRGSNFLQNNPSDTVVDNSTGQSGTGANIDVVYHRIWWRINPDSAKAIKGIITTHFKTIQANVSSITMDLRQSAFNNANLVVTYHGTTCTRTLSASNILTITLPSTIVTSGTLDSMVISYHGVPPAVSGAAQGYQKDADPLTGQSRIYTLSESYEDRDWWPCKADMKDKIDSMDIMVNVPWASPAAGDTFWVASNGKLVDSTISGGSRTFTFRNRYPMASYLVAVSVARYNRYYTSVDVSGVTTQVAYYIHRGKTNATYNTIVNAMNIQNQVLQAFSAKFGDYPYKYEKHGFYDGLAGAGGMEHQTFSAIDGGSTAASTGALTSATTLAHELAHQWFGDKATFATWADIYLAEGFARYCEALAGELVPATGITPTTEMSSAKTAARGVTTTPARITSFTTSAQVWTGANTSAMYDRGCMVVSMLRKLSGDNLFFQACRNYLDSTNGSGYRSATTDSLKNNFNRVLNYDLTPFFNDFVIGVGHPTTAINWNTPGSNKFVVNVASQTRSAGSTASYFHNVIILRLRDAGSNDTTIVIYDIDGNHLAKAGLSTGIGPSVPGNFLFYNLGFTPTIVTFDPFFQTLSNGTITKLTTLAANVMDFAAHKVSNGNQVNLSVTSNEPIQKVLLLKSANGIDFTEEVVMTKVNTNGQVSNYQYTDLTPFAVNTFYRAKVYTATKEEWSSVVKLGQTATFTVAISPNPAKGIVNISFNNSSKQKTNILVQDAEGRVVRESITDKNFTQFDISNLPDGIYLVQLKQQDEVLGIQKLLVHH